ncbi:FMNH2-dependent monooxygenase [Prauserella marina]|uniref:Flavin-dependent oxidoreductase, luciferase family (Includes alkanesulfonate monooxygenase SsuD and methylene tetrahydromethanopterin reductase) n=1 Tax=Prauserella marina TaxID=530584 RepID=A0A222VQ75_9PSEU|nr:LLM class flavin-dependent oxidoreductase [Prauserella marina]ASR35893.1 FMNH2-dependent monooxygenase [Prauserella marina]PWV84184.1 alkanesulfonate monooxygenase SsuD/methylene tetrahydromethanopterin reductase-like flavin-dependent oxidoreductase (luciferase family) [Prauserella marina]SDC28543.1 Flavin-dependent oxidoreductase, luciferase family (includes alkanesulfonate monooxygenase SsuD and methylene tetrahydromethanopterin reductase) [Prauserella marina]
MTGKPELHLATALEATGWHPASWREPRARPGEIFTAAYWTDLVREAEKGLLDFVTIEDSLGPGDGIERTDRVRGRLDSVLIASRVAPSTTEIGLVPTVVATHTEPFHLSKALATLDYVSQGRAGVRVRVDGSAGNAAHFGRRDPATLTREELFAEAADYVEVIRRLWDSWEDEAEIRDVATGRFVDREKLHYIDFEGPWFGVKGPSITPRPPQGQLPVAVLAHATAAYRLAARSADLVFVTPRDERDAARIVSEIGAESDVAGRENRPGIFADLVVFLDETERAAVDRKARLDELAGETCDSDAAVFTGTAGQLAEVLTGLAEQGITGFRLRPGAIPHDLLAITTKVTAVLREAGRYRSRYALDSEQRTTLRGTLGLGRPASRYAEVAS